MKINKLTPGYNLMWESSRFLLPEHKNGLLKQKKALDKKQKPIWDEQHIEFLSQKIEDAFYNARSVAVKIHKNYEATESVQGRIVKVDLQIRKCKMIDQENNYVWIYLDNIIDIDFVE